MVQHSPPSLSCRRDLNLLAADKNKIYILRHLSIQSIQTTTLQWGRKVLTASILVSVLVVDWKGFTNDAGVSLDTDELHWMGANEPKEHVCFGWSVNDFDTEEEEKGDSSSFITNSVVFIVLSLLLPLLDIKLLCWPRTEAERRWLLSPRKLDTIFLLIL